MPYQPQDDLPPVIFLLSRKTRKKYNILVGEDEFLIRLAEQELRTPCVYFDRISDETLLAGHRLFRIPAAKLADLSDNLKANSDFWSVASIRKGSAGATAIVKVAASLVEAHPDRDAIQRHADALAAEGIGDIRSAVWRAAWALLGPVPEGFKRWPGPWEDWRGWLDRNTDPGYRLNSLYHDLVVYTFLANGEEEAIKKTNITPTASKLKYLKSLRIDLAKVLDTVRELSGWRARRSDPYACALRISAIWQH